MVKLIGRLSSLSSVRVLVLGDFMLDAYTTGKVSRISPEAPVPVLHVQNEEKRPGGAGNVALNIMSLGGKALIVGRIGNDMAGKDLYNTLVKEGIDVRGLIIQEGYKTPVKNRVIANSQQLLRIDFEESVSSADDIEELILEKLDSLIEEVDIIAVSDYAKGFLSKRIVQEVICLARKRSISVLIDPKGNDFSKYEGAMVIKPNLLEAYAAAQMPLGAPLDKVAKKIFEEIAIDTLLITRSEEGMTLYEREGLRFDFPVRSKEVKDVTGAGDTVLAMMSMGLGSGMDLKEVIQLCNVAAGIAIERVGCARVNLADVAARLFELHAQNKVFDEEHLFALQQALRGKKYCVLGLKSKKGLSNASFRAIRSIALQDPSRALIVYVRDEEPDSEFIALLSSLAEVDFIVLKGESLRSLLETIEPDRVFSISGGEVFAHEQVGAVLIT